MLALTMVAVVKFSCPTKFSDITSKELTILQKDSKRVSESMSERERGVEWERESFNYGTLPSLLLTSLTIHKLYSAVQCLGKPPLMSA